MIVILMMIRKMAFARLKRALKWPYFFAREASKRVEARGGDGLGVDSLWPPSRQTRNQAAFIGHVAKSRARRHSRVFPPDASRLEANWKARVVF
jgi:hypothetical protein